VSLRRSIVAIFASTLLSGPAFAADAVWDGGGGDGFWSNSLNWSGDVLPASGANVTIASGTTVRLDIDATLGALTVQGVGTTLVVDPGRTLTLSSISPFTPFFVGGASALTNHGTITVLDGQLTAANFINEPSGVVNHSDTLLLVDGINRGTINTSGSMILSGSFDNYGDVVVTNGKSIQWWASAPTAFTNHAAASISGSGWLALGQEEDPATYDGNVTNDGAIDVMAAGFTHGNAITISTTVVNDGTISAVGPIRLACRGDLTGTGGVTGMTVVACHTWVGLGSTTNWSEAANWSFKTLPENGGTKNVLLQSGGSIHLDTSLDLGTGTTTITQDTTLMIDPSRSLMVSGRLEINGTLTVGGVLDVATSGIVDNAGLVSNSGTINNSGDIVNRCSGGSVTASPGSTLTGNPPREECVVWTGGGGDGLWSTGANWRGGLVPEARSKVTIASGATVRIGVDAAATELAVNGVGTKLIVDAGANLTLDDRNRRTGSSQPFVVSATSSLTNAGTIDVLHGPLSVFNFTNENTGLLKGTDNGSTFSMSFATNRGTIKPSGSLDMFGAIDNYGEIIASRKRIWWSGFAPDAFTNHAGGNLSGSGWLLLGREGQPGFDGPFVNEGSVTLTAAGFTHGNAITNDTTIRNRSSIDASPIRNNGTFENECGATVNGVVTGNAIVQLACDSTPPTISCAMPNQAIWHGNNVTVSCTASDAESGLATASDASFSLSTNVATGAEASSAATPTHQVCDKENNCAVAGPYSFMIDRRSPSVTCIVPDTTIWYSANVVVSCTAADSGSGLADAGDASFSLSTSVGPGIEGAAATNSRTVCDSVDNCQTTQPYSFKIDRRGPILSCVAAPTYTLNQTGGMISASVIDFGSGPATPLVAVAIDTASPGLQNASLIGYDTVGNATTVSCPYQVNYDLAGFLDPVDNTPTVNAGKGGKVYALRWQLRDGAGGFVSSLSAVRQISAQETSCSAFTNDPIDALEATAAGAAGLRYDTALQTYLYNWASPRKGCYTLFVSLDSGQSLIAYFNLF
jgi:hypothetical protein